MDLPGHDQAPEYHSRPYQGLWRHLPNKASPECIALAKRSAAAFRCEGCGFKGSVADLPQGEQPTKKVQHSGGNSGESEGQQALARALARDPDTVDDIIAQGSERCAGADARAAATAAKTGSLPVVPVEERERATRVLGADQIAWKDQIVAGSPPAKSLETSLRPSQENVLTALSARVGNPQTPPDRFSALPTDILVQIMDCLDAPALSALVRASKHFVRASTERGAWVRCELQCFHSKRGFVEEVLGFGIVPSGAFAERRRIPRGKCGSSDGACDHRSRRNFSKELDKPKAGPKFEGTLLMDYLSAGAFFEGKVRRGVWNERLECWLSLLLDEHHFARALPLLKGTISALVENPGHPPMSAAALLNKAFNPLDTLKVLPKLMNGMVVSFMNQKGTGVTVDLHASGKALLGYCQLHHMLLWLAQEYPVIQTAIDRALTRFQTTPSARHKKETPNLGELLVLLSAATAGGVTWASIAPAFLAETLDRNVLWLLKDHPELAFLEASDSVSEYRLTTTFDARATARRLIMFQVAFLLLVRPSGSSVSDTLAEYSQRYGYPRPGLTRKLQDTWFQILKVATWPSYYSQLGLECPPNLALCETLRQAVHSSRRKGYHSGERLRSSAKKALLAKRRLVEPSVRTGEHRTEEVLKGPQRPVSAARDADAAPPTFSRESNRAFSGRIQKRTPRQVAVISQNPFSLLASDDEQG